MFARRCKGFTLVELLVALLLPALNSARRQAKITQCLSNIRQIEIAYIGYTSEANHNRSFNYNTGQTLWVPELTTYGYLNQVLYCPEAYAISPTGWGTAYLSWTFGTATGSYAFNGWFYLNCPATPATAYIRLPSGIWLDIWLHQQLRAMGYNT